MPLICAGFTGEVIEWRGPAPFYFVAVPTGLAAQIKEVSSMVTYGWGVVPAVIEIGAETFETALFPKNGGYLVPLKDAVRKVVGASPGDHLTMKLTIENP